MGKPSTAVTRQPLVTTVIETIRHLVTDRTWPIGEKVPSEAELTELFNVGRNTIREAIRVLSHSGMLEVRQGDGTYVRSIIDPSEVMREIDKGGLREHFELRCMIESEAAKYAASRRTDEDLRRIKDALLMRGEYDPSMPMDLFLDRDMVLHNAIVQASNNTAMHALYRYFSISVRQHTSTALSIIDLPEPDLYAHQEVFFAIESNDPESAENAVKRMWAPMIVMLTTHLMNE